MLWIERQWSHSNSAHADLREWGAVIVEFITLSVVLWWTDLILYTRSHSLRLSIRPFNNNNGLKKLFISPLPPTSEGAAILWELSIETQWERRSSRMGFKIKALWEKHQSKGFCNDALLLLSRISPIHPSLHHLLCTQWCCLGFLQLLWFPPIDLKRALWLTVNSNMSLDLRADYCSTIQVQKD